METILIDEKEITGKLVEKLEETNRMLMDSINRRMAEYRLTPNCYIGGLEYAISNTRLGLEQNIKNLIATYTGNFSQSIFFQCENIKLMNTLRLFQDYLTARGLEADFRKFRSMKMETENASDTKYLSL